MRIAALILALLSLAAGPSAADERRAGDFDYYVLALSWTPSWCAAEGDARGSDQCAPGRGHGFTLHGLWPQYEIGWPQECAAAERDPPRARTEAMADIMGSGGLAWHQWKKHGRCTGLAADDYFAISRLAYDRVVRPPILRKLTRAVRVDARVIEAAFIEANPALTPDSVTVTCGDGLIREVRICLTRDLDPRPCGPDVSRDCRGAAGLPPMR